jgi:hypothetical protein
MMKTDKYDLSTVCQVLLNDGFTPEQVANLVAILDEFAEN